MVYRWLDQYFRMKECSYLNNTGRVRESQILSVVDVCLEPSGLISLPPKTFGAMVLKETQIRPFGRVKLSACLAG